MDTARVPASPCSIPHLSYAMDWPALGARYIVKKARSRSSQRTVWASRLLRKARSRPRQSNQMAADVTKHLDRAKRFLEKNRIGDAIEAYLAVLDEAPNHQEATQALGDLYARLGQPERAAVYYGRSEEHTSELQSRQYLVCRLLLEKKKLTQEDKI